MSNTIYCGHSDKVFAVAWSPDGVCIASGSRDTTVRVWNAISGEDSHIYRGHHSCVLSVAWSPDGRYLASGDTDGIVHVWQVGNAATKVVTYRGHARFVRSIAWSPEGSYIASGGDYGDNTVQVWEACSGNHIYTHAGQYRIFAVAWLPAPQAGSPVWGTGMPHGRRIASGSFDGTVQLWTWHGSAESYIYRGHSGPVYTVAWSPDGKHIVSAGQDATVQVWSPQTGYPQGTPLHIYRGHTLPVKAVAWSPDGKYMASGGDDTTVQVWDPVTGRHIATYNEHAHWVRAVAWSPDSKCIVSASDTTVRVWRHGIVE